MDRMRWKLVLITSAAAALLGCGVWSVFTIAVIGSAAAMARREWLLLVSLAIPVIITTVASFFVYRHTSRRRKTQAAITVLAVLLMTALAYFVVSQLFPEYLVIPRTYEVRQAR
jgi:hypothetical protein